MNAVGIDVSKGKSTVAVLRPYGEVVVSPFDVAHTGSDLRALADLIKKLPGETKVVMETTGNYFESIARYLHEQNIFVSVVNPVLISDFVGPQLMAEIGDPRRFHSRKAITAYFGYDSENNDSGQKTTRSNPMTKKGSGALRRTLFIIMQVLLQTKPQDNPVYDFLIKKKSEGKHYYSYINAAANKFLRIYYARVKEVLNVSEQMT